MKILLVNNLYHPDIRGGYELGAYGMVEVLRSRGHEVVVLTSESALNPPAERDVLRTLRLTPIYDRDFVGCLSDVERRAALQRGQLYDPVNVEHLAALCGSRQPDVVYLWNLTGLGSLGLMVATHALGFPAILHLMDYYPEAIASLLGRYRAEYLSFLNHAFAPAIVCCSRTVGHLMQDAGIGLPIEVIYNWVDPRRIPAKESYRVDSRPLRIAYVGQLLESKGLYLAIDAIASLPETYRHRVRLDVIGRGSDYATQQLRERICGGGLEELVTLRGHFPHDEMLQRFQEYDVLLFPTHAREPFAFVAIEAMAAGLAVLLSRDGGNAEIGVDRHNCLMVERSTSSIVAALCRLLDGAAGADGPSLLETLGRQARADVLAAHTIEDAACRVEGVLSAAARRGPLRPSERDSHRVLTLNAAFGQMLTILQQLAPKTAVAERHAPQPGPLIWAWWRMVGEGRGKRAWMSLRVLLGNVAPHPLRRALLLGRDAFHRWDAVHSRMGDRGLRVPLALFYRSRAAVRRVRLGIRPFSRIRDLEAHHLTTQAILADQGASGLAVAAQLSEIQPTLIALDTRLKDVHANLADLAADLGRLAAHADAVEQRFARGWDDLKRLATRIDLVEQQRESQARELTRLANDTAVVLPCLAAVQNKGDATNSDLAGLIDVLRYSGILPRMAPPCTPSPADQGHYASLPREPVTNCPICGAESFTPVGEKANFRIVQCTLCRLMLVNPRLHRSALRDIYAPTYWQAHMDAYGLPRFWDRLASDYTSALDRVVLLQEFRVGRALLDIGCSNGVLVRRTAEWGFKSYGVELTPEMAHIASQLSGRPVFSGDLSETTEMFGGLRFHQITMFDLFEHVYEPDQFLGNLGRILEDGGRLFIETFRTDCDDFQAKRLAHDDVKPVEHIYMYTQDNLERLFSRNNFEVLTRRFPMGPAHSRVVFVLEQRSEGPSHKPGHERESPPFANESSAHSPRPRVQGDSGSYGKSPDVNSTTASGERR
jgi:glycosyltransferase involved in cell wall biosynthesis/2-polyprenyl-3-methyl-5-hydroxy-6-metoxy-1,4-benzoquinol methylase